MRNGYNATYHSNPITQLKNWLKDIPIEPLPNEIELEKNLSEYDLVIADSNIISLYPKHLHPILMKYCVFTFVGKQCLKSIFDITNKNIIGRLKKNSHKFDQLKNLTNASSVTFSDISKSLPMAEIITLF